MTKADHIAAVVAEKDAEIARWKRVAFQAQQMAMEQMKCCDAIEATTIEQCAQVVDALAQQQTNSSAFTACLVAAKTIRALAKPARPITDRTDPEGGIPGRT